MESTSWTATLYLEPGLMATILAVDDERVSLFIVKETLQRAGHDVIAADSGKDVMALIDVARLDAVILDRRMPGTDGLEVLRVLRENPKTTSVPVIILSSLSTGQERVRGLTAGADDYIIKPFEPAELILRVERLIAQARMRRTASDLAVIADLVRRQRPVRGIELGRYQLEELVGEGAMGMVFRGWDPKLDRPVALKTIHLGRGASESRRSHMLKALLKEAVAAAKLTHANVVTVYDVVDEDDGAFLAMELVDGSTLERHVLGRGPLAADQAVVLALAVARALAVAHAGDIVHHDLKPGNVLLGQNGAIKVTDFGLSKGISEVAEAEGEVWGTPGYLPPEALVGRGYDQRGDLFGLGALLHFALTGQPAFRGDTASETVQLTLYEPPSDDTALEDIPFEPFRVLIRKLLAKRPEDRPSSADEVVARLEGMGGRAMRWTEQVEPDLLPPEAMLAFMSRTITIGARHDALASAYTGAKRRDGELE
jgi:serine/threonine-protein kinase